MPRGSAATSNRCRPTPGSSSASCKSPTSITSAGLSPAISIQQKAAGTNPRSTVGTITEIHDYLRVLYARVGQGHCPQCGRPITAQTREQILARILALPEGTRFLVLAPVVRGQKGEYKDLFAGHAQARLRPRPRRRPGRASDATTCKLDRRIKHDIEIVIDRLKIEAGVRTRLAEAVEQALALAEGSLIVAVERTASGARQEATRGRGRSRVRGYPPLRPLRLHALQQKLRAAQPADVQLQQPARHVPGLRRPGHALHLRSRPADSRSRAQLLSTGPCRWSVRCAAWAAGASTSTKAWPGRWASI